MKKPIHDRGAVGVAELPPREFDLDAYRRRVRRLKEGSHRKEDCEAALDGAERAYRLSKGPDPERSAVWRQNFFARWNRLDALLESAER